jgi:hypothetical protein
MVGIASFSAKEGVNFGTKTLIRKIRPLEKNCKNKNILKKISNFNHLKISSG